MFRRQFVGHRRDIPTGIDLAVEAQLAADLADRAHGVDAFQVAGLPVIDNLRVGHARHTLQIATAWHIDGERRRAEAGQHQQDE
ncbi:hypothetical protein D3C84_1059760 [compost metagenome]